MKPLSGGRIEWQSEPVSVEPVGPVFLLDGGDVVVLADPADAGREFEPFLVDEPVEIFDALARRLRLVVREEVRKRWFVGVDGRRTVDLVVMDEEPSEQRLREALSTYLVSTGRQPPSEGEVRAFAQASARLILSPP